jgi:RimJ/RimL family protein N-acetyltransferase
MTEKILEFSRKQKIHRIELSVVAENKAAIRLYQKIGFQIEEVGKDAYYGIDNKYQDMIQMSLIFSEK